MIKSFVSFLFALLVLTNIFASNVFAQTNSPEKFVRWTFREDTYALFDHIVDQVNRRTGLNLQPNDFMVMEQRDLAFARYIRAAQMVGGLPLQGRAIRIWVDLASGRTIQVEASVQDPTATLNIVKQFSSVLLNKNYLQSLWSHDLTMQLVRDAVKENDQDSQVLKIDFEDVWQGEQMVRSVKARGRRGIHFVTLSLFSREVLSYQYRPFAKSDLVTVGPQDISIPARVYEFGEEVEGEPGHMLQPVTSTLKNILPIVKKSPTDVFAPLQAQEYLGSKADPNLGMLPEGRAKGFWHYNYIAQQAAQLAAGTQAFYNNYANGLLLNGRYVSVSIHPEGMKRFGMGAGFPLNYNTNLMEVWKELASGDWQMIPAGGFWGKPITSPAEAFNRPNSRYADHNPAKYMQEGFDELQVYHAVDTLFTALQPKGFFDPELSTRAFRAFLYDPDISMQDNAYYNDDTINFTTYTPKAVNYARDNPTIWHELGHGVMDRLMGPALSLADTGGLSEGMADFVAALVIADVANGRVVPGAKNFRIVNKTGFFMTNEAHDDGEAYGGAMKDMLDMAMRQWGRVGLVKMTDLTLEAMRLTRDHPHLSAKDWFEHMLFADELGRTYLRQPGEMRALILGALASRNFANTPSEAASFSLQFAGQEVVAGAAGSRNRPIAVEFKGANEASYDVQVALKSSANYNFKYPVTVKVFFTTGPLQGAIHWKDEATEPMTAVLNKDGDIANLKFTVNDVCDAINREDGSCVDFAYVQIWNNGETEKPVAKKRFYLKVPKK